ncbi:MAG: hypothetical protein HUK15_04710, partial [Bacteroidales bacterium]|nr:hypothetical protein [Bacteroidales bacterium]
MSALAQMDSVQQIKEKMHIKVPELLNGIMEDVDIALKQAEMNVSIDVGDITVIGDKSLIYSIFRNLFDNAIAYAGQGKSIRIFVAQRDSEKAEFVFEDNGTGVPEEHIPHLCERFYRIDKGRSRKLGGTGLGLAIVKNAVLLHDGEISLSETKGGGLTVNFSLPII